MPEHESMDPRDELSSRRAWLERWRRAGEALDRRRDADLAALPEDEARAITLELLSMWRPDDCARPPSGLVEQQRLFGAFHARRDGGRR